MSTNPATVFKYQRLSVLTLQNLKANSIYFASPTQFNDPYDCTITATIDEPNDNELNNIRSHFVSLTDLPQTVRDEIGRTPPDALRATLVRSAKQIVENAIGRFLAQNGVTCLAERNDDLLMWSHYGDGYKGFCLEFRTTLAPFTMIRPVKYVESMPRINMCDFFVRNQWQALVNLYCTKSAAWSYEKEWRVLHQNAGTLFTYEADALKAVYFGPRMDRQTQEIICLILAGQNTNVELWHVARVPDRFELKFEQFAYTSHVDAKRLGLA